MMGGGSARAALAAVAIAAAAALGACGGDDSGADAAAAPLKRGERDPANFIIVVEASAAMAEDDRLEDAREALGRFFRELPADDSVGLAAYADRFRPVVPISGVRGNRERLAQAVEELDGAGGSALNDAAIESYGILRELAGAGRLDGVLLIAHSADSGSGASASRVRRLLGAQRGSVARVRVITVAYDSGGARGALASFARASGGKAYESEPGELEAVLRRAWSAL
jgi:Mg-chelatase subunit ChlD